MKNALSRIYIMVFCPAQKPIFTRQRNLSWGVNKTYHIERGSSCYLLNNGEGKVFQLPPQIRSMQEETTMISYPDCTGYSFHLLIIMKEQRSMYSI